MIDYYLLARAAGLGAFSLIFIQIITGSLADKIRLLVGVKWHLRLHIITGLLAFVLATLHPLFLAGALGVEQVVNLGGWATLGKIGYLLLATGVLAGLLRVQPWLTRHWHWVHRLNYVVFGLIYVHSWNLGSDTHNWPWFLIYWLSPPVVAYGLYTKLRLWYSSSQWGSRTPLANSGI